MLSRYTAVCDALNAPSFPLNFLKVSTPFAGHRIMPVTTPEVAPLAGPSEAAPQSNGVPPEVPSSAPTRFAALFWMQFGNLLPSPTKKNEPQAFVPRMLASHLCE